MKKVAGLISIVIINIALSTSAIAQTKTDNDTQYEKEFVQFTNKGFEELWSFFSTQKLFHYNLANSNFNSARQISEYLVNSYKERNIDYKVIEDIDNGLSSLTQMTAESFLIKLNADVPKIRAEFQGRKATLNRDFAPGMLILFKLIQHKLEKIGVSDSDKPELPPIEIAKEAVTVWNTQLLHYTERYKKTVSLAIDFENHTSQKVLGVVTIVKILNPFKKVVLKQTFENEIVLPSKTKVKADTVWVFKDNPYIHGEVYDKLWKIAQNGTAQIEIQVTKVVLQDGTILTNKKKKKRNRKKK